MSGLTVSLRQDHPIVLDVSFRCGPGEMLALVGPSGSGKTTVLRAIAGVHRPKSGHITVGEDTWLDTRAGFALPTWRRRVGMVFQSYALFPHLTAVENVAAALLHLPAGDRLAKASDLLALLHLDGLEGRRPGQLSGGQQQRVAVARSLAREPQVLLLDEPFSAVDRATRSRLYRELAALRQRLNMPIVLVTHDLDEALMLADRMCLLQRGEIIQAGSPLEIVQCPNSVDAARLVGHRNLFAARVMAHDEQRKVTVLDWRGGRLEVTCQPQFTPGTEVTWMIPPSKITLRRPDRNDVAQDTNSAFGVIADVVNLGEKTILALGLDVEEPRTLEVHMPRQEAAQLQPDKGLSLRASFAAEAIHIIAASSS